MGIFFVCVIVLVAFIILLMVIVTNTGGGIQPVTEPEPTPVLERVGDSNTDLGHVLFWTDHNIHSSWNRGDIALSYDVAGINKNECSLKHVGVFEGYIEPEPDNAYDQNAIKVMHADGTHLGYIKALETASIRDLFGGSFTDTWPVVGYVKHVIRPGSIWNDEKSEEQQLKENGYFVCRIYLDNKTLCDF